MSGYLDVYVRSTHRDRETLRRFVDEYVDRAASEDRGDEQLMMLPLDLTRRERALSARTAGGDAVWDAWDWEPAATLDHILERALSEPRRAFFVYLTSSDGRYAGGINLGFTTDDRVIFGVSIEDDEGEDALSSARRAMAELAEVFSADEGFVGAEVVAPLIEGAFPRDITRVLATWTRDPYQERTPPEQRPRT